MTRRSASTGRRGAGRSSTIVNINFIDEITKGFGGSYEVRMKDEQRTALPVSRRYKSRLDLG